MDDRAGPGFFFFFFNITNSGVFPAIMHVSPSCRILIKVGFGVAPVKVADSGVSAFMKNCKTF